MTNNRIWRLTGLILNLNCLLIFSQSPLNKMQENSLFSVKPFGELEKILQSAKKDILDFDYQIPGSHACVYELENGDIIVLPGSFDESLPGYLFYDKNYFDSIKSKEELPRIDSVEVNYFEIEKENLSRLPDFVTTYFNYVLAECGLNDSSPNGLDSVFTCLSKRVAKRKTGNARDIIALSVLIGERVRTELSAEWKLEKYYGDYNPFWVPYVYLEGKSSRCSLMDIIDDIHSGKPLNDIIRLCKWTLENPIKVGK
jgi:hypothetical protein